MNTALLIHPLRLWRLVTTPLDHARPPAARRADHRCQLAHRYWQPVGHGKGAVNVASRARALGWRMASF